jgi:hypothetical protein
MGQTSLMRKFFSFIDRYFFKERNLLVVGMIRMFLVFQIFQNIRHGKVAAYDYSILHELHERGWLIDFLGKNIFFALPASLLAVLFAASAFGSFFGIFTRLSLLVFGVLSIYLTGIKASLGTFDHVNCLISQIIVVLALIPGSTNLSADRLFRYLVRYRKGQSFFTYQLFCYRKEPVWGVRLLLILLACVYFSAGFSKLRFGGLKWLDGNTLTHYLDGSASPVHYGSVPPMYMSRKVPSEDKWKDGFGIQSYSYGNRQGNPIAIKTGQYLAKIPLAMKIFAIATIFFELSGLLILVDGWPRTLYLLGAIGMHVSIGFFMNLDFISYRVLCFLLIDWQWVFNQISFLISARKIEQLSRLRHLFLKPIERMDKELA